MSAPTEAQLRILYAELTALPGHDGTVAAMLAEHSVAVRAEPGCIVFSPHRVEGDPNAFFVYEVYRDQEAFEQHIASAHSESFNRALAEHVVGGGSALTWLAPLLQYADA